MLAVPVYSVDGERQGELEIDPASLGGRVRPRLMKQAIVAFLDHQRRHCARTKRRSDVKGSTRKLYRQKGTGNARAGSIRSPIRRGGGHTFAKRGPRRAVGLPKKMRRLARNSAILAKIQSEELLILDGLQFSEPKTKKFAAMLVALESVGGCLLALDQHDENVHRSGRNIPLIDIRLIEELTAYEVLRRSKVIFTKPAFERLMKDPIYLRSEHEEVEG